MLETFIAGNRPIRIDVLPAIAPERKGLAPAILLLHGAGGNIGFWLDRLAPHFRSAGVSVFAPHYFERTDTARADLMTITDGVHVPQWLDTIEAALRFLQSHENVDRSRIALLGVSLGAFLAMAFAAVRSSTIKPGEDFEVRCIVELSGGLPEPYARQATPQMPPTLILHGGTDAIVPVSSATELDALLTRLGAEHETRILAGEGHWFSSAGQTQLLLAVASFLQRHLL